MDIKALQKYLSGQIAAPVKSPIKVEEVPYGGLFVHNVLDTSKEPIPDGYESFLDYWERNACVENVQECASIGRHVNKDGKKSETDEIVGAHVRIDTLPCPDDWAWIVPLCKHCNNDGQTGPIPLPYKAKLIPVHMSCAHPTAKNKLDAWIKLCYKLCQK